MARFIQKELKFKHEGEDYIVVVKFTPQKLKQAKMNASTNNGAALSAVKLYAMSAWRRIFKC